MSEKTYAIATPSLFADKKDYGLLITNGNQKNKSYVLSLSLSDPFIENDSSFPMQLPAGSRFPAILDEQDIILGERIVEVESVFCHYLEEAESVVRILENHVINGSEGIRNRELPTEILTNFEYNREEKEVSANEEGVQLVYRKNTAESEVSSQIQFELKRDTILSDVSSQVQFELKRDTFLSDEVKWDSFDYIDRELIAEIVNDENAMKLIKIIHGEKIAAELNNLKEKIIEANTLENYKGVSRKERVLDSIELELQEVDKEKTLTAELEYFDPFTGGGIPAYLSKFDIFSRGTTELEITIQNEEQMDKKYHEVSIDAIDSFIENSSIIPKEVLGITLERQDQFRKRAVTLDQIIEDMEFSFAKEREFEINTNTQETAIIKPRKEYELIIVDYLELQRTNMVFEPYSEYLEVTTKTDEFTASIIDHAESSRDIDRDFGTIEELNDFDKVNENIMVIDESIRFDRINVLKEETVLDYPIEEMSRKENELLGEYEDFTDAEFRLYEAYMHEFEEFDIQYQEYLTEMNYHEESNRNGNEYEASLEKINISNKGKMEIEGQTILGDEGERQIQNLYFAEESPIFDATRNEMPIEMEYDEFLDFERIQESLALINDDLSVKRVGEKYASILEGEETEKENEIRGEFENIEMAERENLKIVAIEKEEQANRSSKEVNTEIINDEQLMRINEKNVLEIEKDLFEKKPTIIADIHETNGFSRISEIPINVINDELFLQEIMKEATLEREYYGFVHEDDAEPRIWLVHSRPYWWHNWNWRKTR